MLNQTIPYLKDCLIIEFMAENFSATCWAYIKKKVFNHVKLVANAKLPEFGLNFGDLMHMSELNELVVGENTIKDSMYEFEVEHHIKDLDINRVFEEIMVLIVDC